MREHRHALAKGLPPAWAMRLAIRVAAWPGVRLGRFFYWTGFYADRRCFGGVPCTTSEGDIVARVGVARRRALVAAGKATPYVRGSTSEWVRLPAAAGRPPAQAMRILREAYLRARAPRRPAGREKRTLK